jgi:hypothetical protein
MHFQFLARVKNAVVTWQLLFFCPRAGELGIFNSFLSEVTHLHKECGQSGTKPDQVGRRTGRGQAERARTVSQRGMREVLKRMLLLVLRNMPVR